ncbi:MAG: AsmA-like C-terminal region-containing protein, partial [Burkholderiales bacterium]
VLAEPLLPLDRLDATFNWRIETPSTPGTLPQVMVNVRQASFANADLEGEFKGTWSTGTATQASANGIAARFPGRLDLDGMLTQADATRIARYLPLGIDAEARRYVEHAVQAGRLSRVSFRVKGDLNEFPFADSRTAGDGEFRVAGQVEDLSFAYVPSLPATATEPAYASPWPVLDALSGELVFDRLSMEIRNAQAHTQGVKLTGVQGGIQRLDERPVLVLDGAGRGGLADLLRFVNASPVGGWIDNALAQSTATGNADLKLSLTVPLADPPATAVRGSVALTASDLRLRPGTPLLSGARGRIDFSQHGFSIVAGTGKLLGGDVSIDGGMQSDGAMRFAAQGMLTADGLRRSSDVGSPALARLAAFLSGQAAYRVALNLVKGKPELLVTSNLVGLASDLPQPMRKAADAPLALRFQSAGIADAATASSDAVRDFIRLDLGNLLQAQYVRDVSAASPRVLRGGIGVMEPAQMPAAGVAATLNLASVNLGDWQSLLDGLGVVPSAGASSEASVTPLASPSYLPTTIGLRAQEAHIGSRRLNQVVAKVALDGPLWRINLESEQASGTIEYRPPRAVSNASSSNGDEGAAGAAGRFYARLSRLSLPREDTSDVETLLDQPTQSVPALDIVVDDLVLRGKRLGRLELDAANRAGAREWRLTRLALTTPEARLTASGNWAAIARNADTAAGSQATPLTVRRVMLNFKLELSNGGALIERLGFGKLVKGGKGGLSGQIAWDGSPLAMDYPSLTGQINLSIASGQFLKADPGVGRLLGVLSLQALPRRFVLDFRDLFQQGFAFDDISGDLQISEGVAKTNNLRMRGVQAAVLMEGKADIERETQDLRVIVVPEIDAGTASLAYAAINPAIGLGAFLAQTLFSKPLIAASTREFRITGSWAEPKIDKVERGLTDAVPDIPAPSVAPAPPIPAAASASDSEGKP